MNAEGIDWRWVASVIQAHQHALNEIEASPTGAVAKSGEFARRQLVLGSHAFGEFVELVRAHVEDLVRLRDDTGGMTPEAVEQLLDAVAAQTITLRRKIVAFKLILGDT